MAIETFVFNCWILSFCSIIDISKIGAFYSNVLPKWVFRFFNLLNFQGIFTNLTFLNSVFQDGYFVAHLALFWQNYFRLTLVIWFLQKSTNLNEFENKNLNAFSYVIFSKSIFFKKVAQSFTGLSAK